MPCSDEEIKALDKIARKLMSGGDLKSLTFHMSSGLIIDITKEKYLQTLKAGQNPIEQIFHITANATATSSLSLSQNFQNILHDLEASNLEAGKRSEAIKQLNNLENEIKKPNPNERIIKRILNWFCKIDLKTYLKIATTLAELVLKQT